MTQAAVNNAIVLYRLAVERRDVEEAQRVYFVTEKLAQTLANPLIPLTKKYDIIENRTAEKCFQENAVCLLCRGFRLSG